jgi:hypothetical protein
LHAVLQPLADDGILQPEPPPLKLALPILAAAADESREELQDLWSRLLAAAMNPNRQSSFRQAFIETLKAMDPLDSRVFQSIMKQGSRWPENVTGLDQISQQLHVGQDEVSVSFENLHSLKLTIPTIGQHSPVASPYGRLLHRRLA